MTQALSIYLHDHLGAASFAIELINEWIDEKKPNPITTFAAELVVEIERDREVLRQIIERIGQSPHTLKAAAGWLADKASHYKLAHRKDEALARLEALEVISLGILGKQKLWSTLQQTSARDHRLDSFDFEQLASGAKDQHARVEAHRLEAAREAFSFEAAPPESALD